MAKRFTGFLLILLFLVSISALNSFSYAETSNEETLLNDIRAKEYLSLTDLKNLLGDSQFQDPALTSYTQLVSNLQKCEGTYICTHDSGRTDTATLDLYFRFGQPYCQIAYTGLMGSIDEAPIEISENSPNQYIAYPKGIGGLLNNALDFVIKFDENEFSFYCVQWDSTYISQKDKTSKIDKGEETNENYVIKKFKWGDSLTHVKTIEGEPLYEGRLSGNNADYIAYKTQAVGMNVILAYYFCEDGLFSIRYLLNEEHSNNDLYIDDYNKFCDALEKKYGDPMLSQVIWNDQSKKEYYTENGKSMGDALCYGYCTYKKWFMCDNHEITVTMSADNYEITTSIDYLSYSISPGEADYSDEI